MGNPIRILHAVVNMNRGGAETLLMNLYRKIDRTQVQFDFLTCKPGAYDKEINELGGTIHRIPYITEVGHTRYLKAIDQFFASHREYSIVHSHMDRMSGYVLRSAKKAGTPVRIAHSHNTSSEGGLAARTYKWIAGKYIKPSATHFFACSNEAARWLFAERQKEASILQNGIESDRFKFSPVIRKEVRQELNLVDNQLVIGHVGRFAHQKNHSFLIDIFAAFSLHHPGAELVLIGDGPLRLDMEKKVREMQLTDKVRFLGIRSDIYRLLQAFDVFVFPSLHEGLPVSLIEAQGAGVPCVISDVISSEVDMGAGLLHMESLKSSADVWAMKIARIGKAPRDTTGYIQNKGYDIKSSTQWLQNFYLSKLREQSHAKTIMPH